MTENPASPVALYEELLAVNRLFEDMLLKVSDLGGFSPQLAESLTGHELRLRYLRSAISLALLETAIKSEQQSCAKLDGEIRLLESATSDPDDIYLEVE